MTERTLRLWGLAHPLSFYPGTTTTEDGGWPTSPVWMRKYTSDKKLWVPHFSRFLREVGLLMFIRHRLSVPAQFKISKCLGVSNGSMVAETFTSSLAVAIAGKRF